jgi:hypothetical protein
MLLLALVQCSHSSKMLQRCTLGHITEHVNGESKHIFALWNLELSVDEDNEDMEVNDNGKITITVKWPYHAESVKDYLTIWAYRCLPKSTKSGVY